MEPFLGDILLGAYFVISLLMAVVGSLVLRYRREMGPVLLAAAGSAGIASSVIWVLIRSNAVDLIPIIPIVLLAVSLVLASLSVLMWRGRK
jgi:hypothetical protein